MCSNHKQRTGMDLGLLTLSVLSVVWTGVQAFPAGAPRSACANMIPGHGVEPRTSKPLYKVMVNKRYYKPGKLLKVKIRGKKSKKFKGYLIMAKRASDPISNGVDPVGTFWQFDSAVTRKIDCTENNSTAVTHTSNADKDEIEVYWMPPYTNEGKIVFWATIVKEKTVFWTRVASRTIKHISMKMKKKKKKN